MWKNLKIYLTKNEKQNFNLLQHKLNTVQPHYKDTLKDTIGDATTEKPEDIVQDILAGISDDKKSKIICELDREQAIKKAYNYHAKIFS